MTAIWTRRIGFSLVAVLLLAAIFLSLPVSSVQAQGQEPPTSADATPSTSADRSGADGNARLERAYARQQQWLTIQSTRFDRIAERITRLEDLIARLQEQGLDTAPLETALAAFQTAVSDARVDHDTATQTLATHAGFDDQGKVTDRDLALQTLESAGASLDDCRDTLNEANEALRIALADFRQQHPPKDQPTPQP